MAFKINNDFSSDIVRKEQKSLREVEEIIKSLKTNPRLKDYLRLAKIVNTIFALRVFGKSLEKVIGKESDIPEEVLLHKWAFDLEYYKKNNFKGLQRIIDDDEAVRKHWCRIGVKKGLVASTMFDVKYYLEKNEDLRQFFKKDYKGVLAHWVRAGVKEARSASKEFDLRYYFGLHQDLQDYYGDDNFERIADHWWMHGLKEGRRGSKYAPSKNINISKVQFPNNATPQQKVDMLYDLFKKRSEEEGTKEYKLHQNLLRYKSEFSSKDQKTQVSVIMPSYNRRNIIEFAINSVLKQTYKNFELIISDDGSTDGTIEFIEEKYRKQIKKAKIKVLKNEHRGVSAARNAGLEAASSPYIAYLDSDNEWMEDYLMIMLHLMSSERKSRSGYCGMLVLDSTKESYLLLVENNFDPDRLRISNFIDLNCFIHEKSLYDELGGFDEKLTRLVDWDLILKYTYNYPPAICESILVKYNLFENIEHITKKENMYPNFFKINDTAYGSQNVFSGFTKNNELDAQLLDQNLKIGYVLWEFPVLSETFIINELRWLVQNNYDVVVFYKNKPENKAELDFVIESVQITEADELAERLLEYERNMLHGHFAYPTVTKLLYPAAERAQIPFTFTAHGVDIFHYKNVERMRLHVIAQSKFFIKTFALGSFHRLYLMQFQIPEYKIAITPQAVDTSFFSEKEDLFKTRFNFSVCCFTRFVEKKGVEYLIESAPHIPEVTINIYGFGELEEYYRELIISRKLSNVKLHGKLNNRNEVLEVLNQNDLFILPCVRAKNGDMDGVPTVFMEALAAGVPVVTTSISSIPDIIIDGETGYIAKPHDSISLSEKIKEFYSLTHQEVFMMRSLGRKKALEMHNIDSSMRRNLSVWKNEGIDIFLVSWNNFDELKEILRRIYKYTSTPFKLTIVDNNSSDLRVKEYLQDLESKVNNFKLILLEENVFCGPASNIALSHATNKYSIYLCSKEGFVFKHNWEWDMIKYMDNHEDVGIAGHLAYSPSFITSEGLKKLELFKKFRNQDFVEANPKRKYKHVQGGVYIMRNQMVAEIGAFNEKTPHDLMDVEFSYYVESTGWKLGSIPSVQSLTVKTRPMIDSLIDEKTVVAHPLDLNKYEKFDAVTKEGKLMCNICGSEKIDQKKCTNCHSLDIHRSLYDILAKSDFPYRGLKMISTFPGFKGEGEIKKMFDYTSADNAKLSDLERKIKFDIVTAFISKKDSEKTLQWVDIKSKLKRGGTIILAIEDDIAFLEAVKYFKKYKFNIWANIFQSSSKGSSRLVFLLISKNSESGQENLELFKL